MTPRKRDKDTYWWNAGPITDEHEALQVLQEEWNGPRPIYISIKGEKPEICQELHRQGDGGRASSCRIEYFEIDQKLAERLIAEGLVTNLRILHWGSTEVVRDKFVLSESGKYRLEQLYQEKKRLAKSLLIPGKHSTLSGIFNDDGYGRENGRGGGALFFGFKTPNGERVRVYPDTKKVEKLEREKA